MPYINVIKETDRRGIFLGKSFIQIPNKEEQYASNARIVIDYFIRFAHFVDGNVS
ncbi:hypothetical protein YDYSY3_44510 [Paenibacillus chitinolyticus]|nr:hypothetical protein YDYSY3_44510 [Paenibacillus chitinolyticus]